ncbi:MAG: hypothetical protein Q7U68_02190, partial [Candidatus Roizmanbacteria bacterium]|nr:hypothetical protein [Candidatus Roizmanbacteria bacterium]
MGKVKPRLLGNEEIEEKQKKEQKAKSMEKKMMKKKDVQKGEKIVGVDRDQPVQKGTPANQKILGVGRDRPVSKPRGKHYQEAKKMVNANKYYSLKEAVNLLKKMNVGVDHDRPVLKFDQSVELHFVVDETGLKGELELPFSTGKTVRVKIVDDK